MRGHRGSESHCTLTMKETYCKTRAGCLKSSHYISTALLGTTEIHTVLSDRMKDPSTHHEADITQITAAWTCQSKYTCFLWWRWLLDVQKHPVTSIAIQNTLNSEKQVLLWQFTPKRTELDNTCQLWNYFVGIQATKDIPWLGVSHSLPWSSHQEHRTRQCIIKNYAESNECWDIQVLWCTLARSHMSSKH